MKLEKLSIFEAFDIFERKRVEFNEQRRIKFYEKQNEEDEDDDRKEELSTLTQSMKVVDFFVEYETCINPSFVYQLVFESFRMKFEYENQNLCSSSLLSSLNNHLSNEINEELVDNTVIVELCDDSDMGGDTFALYEGWFEEMNRFFRLDNHFQLESEIKERVGLDIGIKCSRCNFKLNDYLCSQDSGNLEDGTEEEMKNSRYLLPLNCKIIKSEGNLMNKNNLDYQIVSSPLEVLKSFLSENKLLKVENEMIGEFWKGMYWFDKEKEYEERNRKENEKKKNDNQFDYYLISPTQYSLFSKFNNNNHSDNTIFQNIQENHEIKCPICRIIIFSFDDSQNSFQTQKSYSKIFFEDQASYLSISTSTFQYEVRRRMLVDEKEIENEEELKVEQMIIKNEDILFQYFDYLETKFDHINGSQISKLGRQNLERQHDVSLSYGEIDCLEFYQKVLKIILVDDKILLNEEMIHILDGGCGCGKLMVVLKGLKEILNLRIGNIVGVDIIGNLIKKGQEVYTNEILPHLLLNSYQIEDEIIKIEEENDVIFIEGDLFNQPSFSQFSILYFSSLLFSSTMKDRLYNKIIKECKIGSIIITLHKFDQLKEEEEVDDEKSDKNETDTEYQQDIDEIDDDIIEFYEGPFSIFQNQQQEEIEDEENNHPQSNSNSNSNQNDDSKLKLIHEISNVKMSWKFSMNFIKVFVYQVYKK